MKDKRTFNQKTIDRFPSLRHRKRLTYKSYFKVYVRGGILYRVLLSETFSNELYAFYLMGYNRRLMNDEPRSKWIHRKTLLDRIKSHYDI